MYSALRSIIKYFYSAKIYEIQRFKKFSKNFMNFLLVFSTIYYRLIWSSKLKCYTALLIRIEETLFFFFNIAMPLHFLMVIKMNIISFKSNKWLNQVFKNLQSAWMKRENNNLSRRTTVQVTFSILARSYYQKKLPNSCTPKQRALNFSPRHPAFSGEREFIQYTGGFA